MSDLHQAQGIEEMAPPERSTVVGGSALLAGVMMATVVIRLSVDSDIPSGERLVAGGLGGLVAFAALVGARRLLVPRGGLWLDVDRSRLGVGITGPRDIWWIAFERIARVLCERHQITSDVADFAWRTSIQLSNGVRLIVVETHERDIAEAVAEKLRERIGRGDEAAPATGPAPISRQTTLRVHRGVALHGVLTVAAFTLTVLGAALYSQIHVAPAAGFLFAPVLLFTGLALGVAVGIKRIATEQLTHKGGLWTHCFTLGSRRWAERSVSAPRPRWNLHVRPARGARLELEGDDGCLDIGHGTTTISVIDIEGLIALPDRFEASPDEAAAAP